MLLMTDPHSPRQNHLLDDLTAAEYKRLFPHLELVSMPLGAVLYESGGELRHAYFPTTCIVSMLYVMEDGASAAEGVSPEPDLEVREATFLQECTDLIGGGEVHAHQRTMRL